MKTEVLFSPIISIAKMVPNMPVPMVIILMEVISMSSLAKEENK